MGEGGVGWIRAGQWVRGWGGAEVKGWGCG